VEKMIDYYGDYAVSPIPLKDRRSFASVFWVVAGISATILALYAGAAIGSGLPFRDAVIAVAVGFFISSLIGGLLGAIAAGTGVSTVMIGRHVFGRVGTVISALLISITSIGWYAMNAGFFGQVLNTMFPGHPLTDPQIAALWGGLLMMVTAIIGFGGLSFLSFLTVPVFIVITFAAVGAVVSQVGVGLFELLPPKQMSLAEGITIAAGGMAVGAVIAPDIARWARNPKEGFLAYFFGVWIMDLLLVSAGAAMILVHGDANVPAAMLGLGLGVGALFMLILGQWTTNDNNLYSAALALENLFPVKKSLLTTILGVIGTVLGAFGAINYFVNYMTILGTYIPPIGGVMIADYYIVRRYIYRLNTPEERYPYGPGTKYSAVNILSILSFPVGGYLGSSLPGIPAINAIIIAVLVYVVSVALFEKLGIPYRFGEIMESETGF